MTQETTKENKNDKIAPRSSLVDSIVASMKTATVATAPNASKVVKLNDRIEVRAVKIEVTEANEVTNILFKKLMREICRADTEQLKIIEDSINSLGDEDKNKINARLTASFQQMYNRLNTTLDEIAPKVTEQYQRELKDIAGTTLYGELRNNGYARDNFQTKMGTWELALSGSPAESISGTSIERPIQQGMCISLLKVGLKPENTKDTWQELRKCLSDTINAGSSNKMYNNKSYFSCLTEEKHPFLRALKDALDEISMEYRGIPIFGKSKSQLFKSALSDIKNEAPFKELDALPSLSKTSP